MLLGDMNTRTATWGDFTTYGIFNSAIFNDVAELLTYEADVVLHIRKNPDVTVNDFGWYLSNLCKSSGSTNFEWAA